MDIKKIEELLDELYGNQSREILEDLEKRYEKGKCEGFKKLYPYIIEEIGPIKKEELGFLVEGIMKFETPLDFIKYFFRETGQPLGKKLLDSLEGNTEELIELLESMEDSGVITYIVELNGFYVWLR